MKKNGFTLVELITTFALAAVIITILVNISLILKNTYHKSDIKTKLLIEQANLSKKINLKLLESSLISYNNCNDYDICYVFNFLNGSSVKLLVGDTYIKFDNYVYELVDGTKIERPVIMNEHVPLSDLSVNDSFLVIKIPIKNNLYPNKDFGINIVYPYNSNEITL